MPRLEGIGQNPGSSCKCLLSEVPKVLLLVYVCACERVNQLRAIRVSLENYVIKKLKSSGFRLDRLKNNSTRAKKLVPRAGTSGSTPKPILPTDNRRIVLITRHQSTECQS